MPPRDSSCRSDGPWCPEPLERPRSAAGCHRPTESVGCGATGVSANADKIFGIREAERSIRICILEGAPDMMPAERSEDLSDVDSGRSIPRFCSTAAVGYMNVGGVIAISLAVTIASSTAVNATCPFCSAVSQTFTEEMASMDVVVFAELIESVAPPADLSDPTAVNRAKFRVTKVLKGSDFVAEGGVLETIYFGDSKEGDQFLVQGIRPPDINWTTPMRVSERARTYLATLDSLASEGADRLAFFQQFLEDEDEMLARDAYDEFANAPYDWVKALASKMNHDQLVAWVKNPDISASRKRLYFTMLGVCGKETDVPLLEELMSSTDRRQKAGLDALIACYLTLRGEEGLSVIEKLFLANHEADYSDTYAAITALRFHGTEGDRISKSQIVQALHPMLDRPTLADLVIPDLARWEDWSVMDRLVELFKSADEKTSWVRVPVINYLRACPLPEAKTHLEELEKIDPDAVRRANTFFPVLDELDEEGDGGSDDKEESPATEGGAGSLQESSDSTLPGDMQSAFRRPVLALTGLGSDIETPGVTALAELSNRSQPGTVEAAGAWSDLVSGRSPGQSSTERSSQIASIGKTPANTTMASGRLFEGVSRASVVVAALLLCAAGLALQWSILNGALSRFFN